MVMRISANSSPVVGPSLHAAAREPPVVARWLLQLPDAARAHFAAVLPVSSALRRCTDHSKSSPEMYCSVQVCWSSTYSADTSKYPYLEDDSAAFCQREVHSRVHFRRPSTSAVALEQCLLGRPLEVYCTVPFYHRETTVHPAHSHPSSTVLQ